MEAKRRILTTGLTVWLNPDGKKKKKIGVKYPIMEMGPGKGKGMERNKSPEIMLDESQLGNMMVQGIFSDDMEILQKHYPKTDLDVMIGFDSTQNLLYEMKIPLDLLKQKAKDNFEKIAVGFEVTEDTRPTGGAPQVEVEEVKMEEHDQVVVELVVEVEVVVGAEVKGLHQHLEVRPLRRNLHLGTWRNSDTMYSNGLLTVTTVFIITLFNGPLVLTYIIF
ncbi:MAG: hypothetical protein IPJ20_18370 [Flammeovirgaceae bacterium]|nr:hypothetical protein [Flammeovirgaceae bacterium]